MSHEDKHYRVFRVVFMTINLAKPLLFHLPFHDSVGVNPTNNRFLMQFVFKF